MLSRVVRIGLFADRDGLLDDEPGVAQQGGLDEQFVADDVHAEHVSFEVAVGVVGAVFVECCGDVGDEVRPLRRHSPSSRFNQLLVVALRPDAVVVLLRQGVDGDDGQSYVLSLSFLRKESRETTSPFFL